jgi:hypothetical protein
MRRLSLACASSLTLTVALAFASISLHAQSSAKAATGKKWTPPRTADGHPDLQGTFDFATATPLERPASLGNKAVLSRPTAAAAPS